MVDRRLYRGRYKDRFKHVNMIIRQRVKEAKQSGLVTKCADIEELEENHISLNMHKSPKRLQAYNTQNKEFYKMRTAKQSESTQKERLYIGSNPL